MARRAFFLTSLAEGGSPALSTAAIPLIPLPKLGSLGPHTGWSPETRALVVQKVIKSMISSLNLSQRTPKPQGHGAKFPQITILAADFGLLSLRAQASMRQHTPNGNGNRAAHQDPGCCPGGTFSQGHWRRGLQRPCSLLPPWLRWFIFFSIIS